VANNEWTISKRDWPGSLRLRRDPGDSASIDCGTRSRTSLISRTNWARFVCAHGRVTVTVSMGERPALEPQALARLILYLASLTNTCDCFRARWKRLNNGEKFSRVTAIRMWK